MTLPVLGPMTLSGFEHAWFFPFLLVVLGLIGLYIVVQQQIGYETITGDASVGGLRLGSVVLALAALAALLINRRLPS
jgi:hypothetical protein